MENIAIIVNIILSVLSFLLAATSIILVVISIRQNNKMLYANSRPYLTAYFAYEENNCELYLCVKNCGNSSAVINAFCISPDLSIRNTSVGDIIENTLLAPNQQIHFDIPQRKDLMKQESHKFKVSIKYKDVNTRKKHSFCERYEADISYMLNVMSTEHKLSSLDKSENTLYNLEKDVKAMMLNNL